MRFAAAWLVVASLLSLRAARASPEDLFGLGPRSSAMGATGAAAATGWEASYANPALLSRVRRQGVALGLQGAVFDLRSQGTQLPGRVSSLPARGLVVGIQVPVPLGGWLRDRVGLGMALYAPSDTLVRAHILYPEAPSFPLLADRAQSLATRFGAGADVGHGLRVGAGVAVLAELLGTISVAGTGGAVTTQVDDQLVATYAPTLGLAWEAPPGGALDVLRDWRFGATWRGSLQARFDVTVDASMLSTLSLPPLHIGGVAQYDPEEVALEIARERGSWVVAAGVTWKRWSSYPGPFEAAIACAAGSECAALAPPPIRLADTFAPRVGVERTVAGPRRTSVRVRGGFLLEPTPVASSLPSSQAYDARAQALADVPTRFFDTTRAVFSAGGGVDLGELAPLTCDLFVQWHWLLARTVDTPPSPPATLSGGVLAWGLTLGAAF